MIAPVFYVLTFISVSTQATPIGHGTPIKFDVTTQYHDGVIPNAFNLRCTPQGRGTCAKTIMSIRVSKNEDTVIASIQGGSISYGRLMKSSVKAEGHIDTDMSKTFLSVTINDAVREDSGLYTCTVVYLDESLHVKYDTVSDNVTISNQDTQDIIKHLMSKISFLENLVKFQQDELSNVKTSLVDQGTKFSHELSNVKTSLVDQGTKFSHELSNVKTSLVDQGTKFSHELSNVKTSLVDQGTKFSHELSNVKTSLVDQGTKFSHDKETRLQDQETQFSQELSNVKTALEQHATQLQSHAIEIHKTKNTTVIFMAVRTRKDPIVKGHTLVYDDVIENIGGGYNGSTGVFTAPVAGDYLLSISVTPFRGHGIRMYLKSSRNEILSRLYAYNEGSSDYEDATCVSRLEAGERVWPYVRYAHSGTTLWGELTQDRLNKFHGYLIKMT